MDQKIWKKSYSWPKVLILLYFFFPVGIYMLVTKMSTEKADYTSNGKGLKILGWVLIGMALLTPIMGMSGMLDTGEDVSVVGIVIFALLVFGSCGAFALYKASTYIKKGEKYGRYVSIINSINDTSIGSIATAYPTSYETALEDLRTMVAEGYFVSAHLDLERGVLVILGKGAANPAARPDTAPVQAQPQKVICSSCGGPNEAIPGIPKRCEYCGAPITIESGTAAQ